MLDFAGVLGLHIQIIPKELWSVIVAYVSDAVTYERAKRHYCCLHRKSHTYPGAGKRSFARKIYKCKYPSCPVSGCYETMNQVVIHFTDGERHPPGRRNRYCCVKHRKYSKVFCKYCPQQYFIAVVTKRVWAENEGKTVTIHFQEIKHPSQFFVGTSSQPALPELQIRQTNRIRG